MTKQNPFRLLFALTLAVLLCSTAGATAATEQVLLTGDSVSYEAESTTFQEIDDVPTICKTFVLPPDVNPEWLREDDFTQDGYIFHYERMDKKEQPVTDTQPAEEIVSMDSKTDDISVIYSALPHSRSYNKDGYAGTLLLDTESVKVAVSRYNVITESHPHKLTRTYAVPYNDRSLIPTTVQSDDLTLDLIRLDWSENTQAQSLDAAWLATAVYSKTTYTKRQEEAEYHVTARYHGQVSKTTVPNIRYVVTYVGEEIPTASSVPSVPPLPSIRHPSNSQDTQTDTQSGTQSDTPPEWMKDWYTTADCILLILTVSLLGLLAVWWIYWHIARVYVYDDVHHNYVLVKRSYISVEKPELSLSAFASRKETEYTVVFHKTLARKLRDKGVRIKSTKGNPNGSIRSIHSTYVVSPFIGKEYRFSVNLPQPEQEIPSFGKEESQCNTDSEHS